MKRLLMERILLIVLPVPMYSDNTKKKRRARDLGTQAGRTVLIEFESYDAAVAAYESEAYQEVLRALDGGGDRDIRLFEGVD